MFLAILAVIVVVDFVGVALHWLLFPEPRIVAVFHTAAFASSAIGLAGLMIILAFLRRTIERSHP